MKRTVSVVVLLSMLLTLVTPLSASRYYDSGIGRWLVPDPADQYWSPYAYCGNNPIVYVDEDGEFAWFIPVLIGASLGGYSGYKIGEAKGANGLGLFGYVLGGALIGGATGYMGSSIASAGGAFSQTGSILASSYSNSLGMSMLSGGMTDVSMNFGFGSFNFNTGKFGFLGQKGNSALENIGYSFGTLANIQDIASAFNGTNVDIVTKKMTKDGVGDKVSHSAIVNEADNINVSVGPGGEGFESYFDTIEGVEWDNHLNDGNGIKLRIPNVNKSAMQRYTKAIQAGSTKWNLFSNSCVSHASKALLNAGVIHAYVPFIGAIHPYILHTQMTIRQAGIATSGILTQSKY